MSHGTALSSARPLPLFYLVPLPSSCVGGRTWHHAFGLTVCGSGILSCCGGLSDSLAARRVCRALSLLSPLCSFMMQITLPVGSCDLRRCLQ